MKWPGRVLAAATGLFGIKPPSTVHIVGDTYLDVIAKIQDLPKWDGDTSIRSWAAAAFSPLRLALPTGRRPVR